MSHDQTAEQVFDSLTGFEEMAISGQFGRTIGNLAQEDPSMFGRALIFIVKRREGGDDVAAKEAALSLTMREFTGFFAEQSDEEAGKEQGSEQEPATSLSSVS